MRLLAIGALLICATVATAAEAPIETIVVIAKPKQLTLSAIDRQVLSVPVELASPMPTDMPEAEVDFHMSQIDLDVAPSGQRVKS
jgi:hypothetical protein